MKTKKLNLVLIILLLSSCKTKEEGIIKENHLKTIYVASDLHLFSNELMSNTNTKYIKEKMTSDGRIQEKDYQIMESFINDINTNKPDYVMLTGDLTFNGEKASHEEIKNFLDKIDSNIKVYVIPGNHDMYNINASSYLNDTISYTTTIDTSNFKAIYSNYGYNNAFSYDNETLSYATILDDKFMAIMIDSTLSRFNEEMDYNYVGGGLNQDSIDWIEYNLKYAKDNNLIPISFMHHNLVTHNELFTSLYTIGNNDLIIELYKKYNVKLNFSGHLHIQSIKEVDGIYDIASSSILDYPCQYGILDLYDNCFEYHTQSVNLNNIINDSFNCFYSKYYNKNTSKYENEVNDYISKVNCYYFSGEYEKINKLNEEDGNYKKVVEESNNKYASSIMNVENKNQTYLISKWD